MGGARFHAAVRLLHPAAPWAYPGEPVPSSVRHRGKNAIAIVTRLAVDFALPGVIMVPPLCGGRQKRHCPARGRALHKPPPYPSPQAGEGRVGQSRPRQLDELGRISTMPTLLMPLIAIAILPSRVGIM